MRKLLSKIFWSTTSSRKNIDKYQEKIRDVEWEAFRANIKKDAALLEVGCGTGYLMYRAAQELRCDVKGIDPAPGDHGVGRFTTSKNEYSSILEASAEDIPFDGNTFDTILCSHVLEHVQDEQQSLREMKRVLKDDGVLIIGMPTALMSIIRWITKLLFASHINFLFFLKSFGKRTMFKRFWSIFVPLSHSYPRAQRIFYDLKHYRVKNWEQIIVTEFKIIKTIQPALYPYPEHPQWFPLHRSKLGSSSVFFVCVKKTL
jgi:ubiquinone/menaquinone biosynthesis C-methylase UbiE